MMRSLAVFAVLVLVLILNVGCSKQDCTDQMADKKAEHGPAEEVNTYDSGDYHNVDWWYWSKGFEYSFTWGDNINGCEVSKYTFSPIHMSPVDRQAKEAVEANKVLVERFFCPGTSRL